MIKTCSSKDLDALKRISYKTFDETFRPNNKPENIDEYLKDAFTDEKLTKELENPNCYFYFIYHEDKLAGYLKLNINDAQTETMGDNALEIERIYILEGFQKLGLGKKLYNHAIEVAKTLNREKVWLGVWEENNNAIQFYKRLGFVEVDQHAFYMGTDRQIDLIMTKSLIN